MAERLPPHAHERLARLLQLGTQGQVRHPLAMRIVDLIFPEPARCPLCNFPFFREAKGWSRVHLCARCEEGVAEIVGGVCRICGRPDAGPVCQECQGTEHLFFSARAYGRYQGVVEAAIKGYKYQGMTRLLPVLGNWITEAYLRYYGDDREVRVAPVPMHPVKKANRGFNQAEELAKYLCRSLKLPYVDVLERTVAGDSQATHNRKERRYAEQNPFALRQPLLRKQSWPHRLQKEENPIAGQIVVLVDDVLTTGNTADACAEVLYRQGAVAVHVLTVAR